MRLIQIEVGSMRNFNYVAGDEATPRAALIDPAWEVGRVLSLAAGVGLKVTDLLVTHAHHDHIEGIGEAQRATGAAVTVHRLEAAAVRKLLDPGVSVRELEGGETVTVGGLRIHAMHTPGHTPGALCYVVPAGGDEHEGAFPGGVFTGDTLFIGRCGRTDFTGSDPEAMFASLGRLAALAQETIVYPGHNYADRPTSTIGEEKINNVHMSAPNLREFLRRRMGAEYLLGIESARRPPAP